MVVLGDFKRKMAGRTLGEKWNHQNEEKIDNSTAIILECMEDLNKVLKINNCLLSLHISESFFLHYYKSETNVF